MIESFATLFILFGVFLIAAVVRGLWFLACNWYDIIETGWDKHE